MMVIQLIRTMRQRGGNSLQTGGRKWKDEAREMPETNCFLPKKDRFVARAHGDF